MQAQSDQLAGGVQLIAEELRQLVEVGEKCINRQLCQHSSQQGVDWLKSRKFMQRFSNAVASRTSRTDDSSKKGRKLTSGPANSMDKLVGIHL